MLHSVHSLPSPPSARDRRRRRQLSSPRLRNVLCWHRSPPSSTTAHRSAPVCVWLEAGSPRQRCLCELASGMARWVLRQRQWQHFCVCTSRQRMRVQVGRIAASRLSCPASAVALEPVVHCVCVQLTPRAATSPLARTRATSASGLLVTCFSYLFCLRVLSSLLLSPINTASLPRTSHCRQVFAACLSLDMRSVQSELSAPCKKLDEWLAAVRAPPPASYPILTRPS